MQLGFVIDHSRCIGCHACTVACKAENDVPVGKFRTWVKYTERGSFPQVKRSFAVLRCNQCTQAPCVDICPVGALEKRSDGIVDIDPATCIGCKACMQGCPYDALYLNEDSGTAEKCHFCAHRTEIGLAPACAVVCPTEAIIPGDFHDPGSCVSQLRDRHQLTARKEEAGTLPNVLYRDAEVSGIDPLSTSANGGYLWADRPTGIQLEVDAFQAALAEAENRATARTTYDVDHTSYWGGKVSAYLFTKSLGTGIFMILAFFSLPFVDHELSSTLATGLGASALFFLVLTTLLLVADLKRPERFLYILLRPNWRSWLTRGSVVLASYGGLLAIWIAVSLRVGPESGGGRVFTLLVSIPAALSACYTGWLFGQAKGRVLWMRRGLWAHLIVQAMVAGAAFSLLVCFLLSAPNTALAALRWTLAAALGLHAVFVLEHRMAPPGRAEEFHRAMSLITRGPYARRHYGLGILAGVVLPVALLMAPEAGVWAAAAAAGLFGLWVEEDVLVRAGQALPIS